MRLKELRQKKRLLQRDVAKVLNCSTPVYCRYETGEREPQFDIIKKLADYYDVTIDYLMGGEDTKEPLPTTEPEKDPYDKRAEGKLLIDAMTEEQYQSALQYLEFLRHKGQ